jgi:hypothetical protein
MSQRTTPPHIRVKSASLHPRYPLPGGIVGRLAWSALWGRRRSFAGDARSCISHLDPGLHILGLENIPAQPPCLVTANHYTRLGFKAWWIAFAISASLPFELHWVMTDAWRFEGNPFARQLEALSRQLFRRIAQVYGFTSMPSMPPRDDETQARARSVRSLLQHARQQPCPAIGLVPEGYDMSGGLLGIPPAGVGRLIGHLLPYTQRILPVGIYEAHGRLCLRFGEPFRPETPNPSKPEHIDCLISEAVMQAIAQLLPFHLRGAYL